MLISVDLWLIPWTYDISCSKEMKCQARANRFVWHSIFSRILLAISTELILVIMWLRPMSNTKPGNCAAGLHNKDSVNVSVSVPTTWLSLRWLHFLFNNNNFYGNSIVNLLLKKWGLKSLNNIHFKVFNYYFFIQYSASPKWQICLMQATP